MNSIDIIDWGKLEDAIEENLPDNNTQAITAEKLRDTLYEFEDKTITLDDNIASVKDTVNVLDETCARKKYYGYYPDKFTLSENYNFYGVDFNYYVEEATVETDESIPQDGLYINCNFNLASPSINLTTASGIFFKSQTQILMNWNNLFNKILELTGIGENEYILDRFFISASDTSYSLDNLIFLKFRGYNLNCLSTESLTDTKISATVNIEFYMIKQNND